MSSEDVGVVHGRLQVLHNDHLRYILAGKECCGHLVVGITNPDPSLTRTESSDPERSLERFNPLTYFERYQLVRASLQSVGVEERAFSIVPFPINVPELYRYYVPGEALYFLTIYDAWGRRKLERFRSLGLRTKVLWERPPEQKGLTGKTVREVMAQGGAWEQLVPAATVPLLREWGVPERLRGV
jgi:hypothetical protein